MKKRKKETVQGSELLLSGMKNVSRWITPAVSPVPHLPDEDVIPLSPVDVVRG